MANKVKVKLYSFGPDWVAATSLTQATRFYADFTGMSYRETLEECEGPISYEKMDKLGYYDDIDTMYEDDKEPDRTFREQLTKMLDSGEKAPFFFATSEC